jgi:hypothetical protein
VVGQQVRDPDLAIPDLAVPDRATAVAPGPLSCHALRLALGRDEGGQPPESLWTAGRQRPQLWTGERWITAAGRYSLPPPAGAKHIVPKPTRQAPEARAATVTNSEGASGTNRRDAPLDQT